MSTSRKVRSTFLRLSDSLKLRILDAPEDRMDEAVNLYVEYYLKGESVCKAAEIRNNQEAIGEYRAFASQELKNLSQMHIMICCVVNNDDTNGSIVGVSFSFLSTTETPFEIKVQPQTREVQKMLQLSEGMISLYDVLKKHEVDKCYDGLGIIVHPHYRGMGIAQEFLKTRRLLCEEQGVPVTAAWMTSIGTQKAAERDGYETVYEFNFKEFGKKYDVIFEDSPKTCKFMLYKVL